MKKAKHVSPFLNAKSRVNEIKKNGLTFNILGLIPLIWGIMLVFLIVWALLICFAEPNWYLDHANTFIVKEFTTENFQKAIANFHVIVNGKDGTVREAGFWEMTWNGTWFMVGCTFMKVMATVCFAYACSRFEFRGRKLLYGFVVLQMMLPVYGQTAANFSLMSKLGLVNSPLFLLGMGAGHGMYFLILYSFFRSLPVGYEEAAMMDGASTLVIFWKIMLPLAKPILSAFTILTAIGAWSDYSTILIYLKDYPNLATGLYYVKEAAFNTGLTTPSYFAAIFISVIPIAVVTIVFNKQIMTNVTIGGLKG